MSRGARAVTADMGWWAWVARGLSVVVLLAALFVPPFTGIGDAVAEPSMSTAALPSDATDDAPAPSDGMVHAGAHCACHPADQLESSFQAGPTANSTVEHPDRATRPHRSRIADPPSRPPQA